MNMCIYMHMNMLGKWMKAIKLYKNWDHIDKFSKLFRENWFNEKEGCEILWNIYIACMCMYMYAFTVNVHVHLHCKILVLGVETVYLAAIHVHVHV